MTLRKGLPAKLAATDANDTRYDFNNLVVCNADGSPRPGVTAPLTALVSATATMNVSVAAFNAVAVRDGGVVLLANDGPVNVLLSAAPAANSRIDVIYAKQNDSSSTVNTPDASNTPVLDKVTGVADVSPVKPAVPVGAVELATVLVPSTATATNSGGVVITQTAQFTAAPGGVVPFWFLAQLNAWTNPPRFQRAMVLFDGGQSQGEYLWTGGGWTRSSAFAIAQGTGTIPGVSAGASANATITFPAGRFGQPPFVFAMPMSSRVTPSVSAVTTAAATLNWGNWSSGPMASTAFWWLAIQMTPGTADG